MSFEGNLVLGWEVMAHQLHHACTHSHRCMRKELAHDCKILGMYCIKWIYAAPQLKCQKNIGVSDKQSKAK